MDYESTFIMPTLLIYYKKGHTELEAYQDISSKYGPLTITLKTTRKWFAKFRINNKRSVTCKSVSRPKFTDDYLINLINQNPTLNMEELGNLCGTSSKTISNRLRQINKSGVRVKYVKKYYLNQSLKAINRSRKFSDEYLIKLVGENPELSMKRLGELAGCSTTTIARRIEQINADGDKVGYCKKSFLNFKTKFTDEFLINLINDNPDLNMNQLAELSNSSSTTISSRIKQINKFSNRVNYVKKQYLNQNLKHYKKPFKFSDDYLIELINNNLELNIAELAKLANSSPSTISARIRKINSVEHRINYTKKVPKQSKAKLKDEALVALINNNPTLNMRELGRLADVNERTISRRLKQLNKDGDVVTYVKKKTKASDIGLSDDELIEVILNNHELNIGELAKVINCPRSKLLAKIKQLNDKEVVHIKKYFNKSNPKLSDEELLNLKKSNPKLSFSKLAEIVGCATSTVHRRLKRINSAMEERGSD
jgi:transcriptional antiterminator